MKQKKKKKRKREIKEKKEINNRIVKDRIIRNIRTLYYYKPKRVSNFLNNNCFNYESSGDKNRNLSLDECLSTIKP